MHPPCRSTGFTLVEAVFVLAIMAIILSVAAPNYSQYHQRQQLLAAAETLTTELRNARELSVSSATPIYVNYRAGTPWCWGVSRGQPCDCAGLSPLPRCSISQSDASQFPDVTLDDGQNQMFSPRLGQATLTGSASLRTRKGQNLRVVLNPMGRVSICGPDAPGGKPC